MSTGEQLVMGSEIACPPGGGGVLLGKYCVQNAITHRRRVCWQTPVFAPHSQKFADYGNYYVDERYCW